MNNKVTKILLILSLVLTLGLRVYRLGEVPPSISWDEAAVGYNAWTIANWGRDEYGKLFPLYFRSFGEGKNLVDIYFTALLTKLLGLSEFSTRLPVALFGVLNVILLYFLSKTLFKSTLVGLIAAIFLAISPYNIHFSRFNHEANFALFFFMLGILLFIKSLGKNKILLSLSVVSFITSFLSYNPPKLIVPIIFSILVILYARQLLKSKLNVTLAGIILITSLLLILNNRELLGTERLKQTTLSNDQFEKTYLFKKTGNLFLGQLELTGFQYISHFTPLYLFIRGDKNPILSSQTGQFYKIDSIFLIIGLLYLVYKRQKSGFVLLSWALTAPLPASLVSEVPHAGRAMFMMGSWHIISAIGVYFIFTLLPKYVKWGFLAGIATVLIFSLLGYLNYYFGEYTTRYAIQWQYGMKQIVDFTKEHPEYDQVFITDERLQPYIFFLYFLKYPLPDYLNTVLFNNSKSKSYNNVSNFGNFYFGGWDIVESLPHPNVVYVLTPYQYDGLRHKAEFEVKKLIKYPNGVDAFFIVSKKS